MVKTAFVAAMLSATALAFSADFIQGAETGIFMSDES
jgi:hypothetical protein